MRHLLSMSANATGLTRIGRMNFHYLTPSLFRFGTQLREKGRPCRVTDTLCQTMIMHHAIDGQVFHTDHAVAVDNLPRCLMREILPLELDTLMDTCNDLAMFCTLWCAL